MEFWRGTGQNFGERQIRNRGAESDCLDTGSDPHVSYPAEMLAEKFLILSGDSWPQALFLRYVQEFCLPGFPSSPGCEALLCLLTGMCELILFGKEGQCLNDVRTLELRSGLLRQNLPEGEPNRLLAEDHLR